MGKPLISDAQMLAMHAAMVHLRQIAPARSAAAASGAWPIALLSAALLQLQPDDMLVTAGEAPLTVEVLRQAQASTFHPELLPFTVACEPGTAAAIAAGHALAQSQGTRPGDRAPLTLVMLHARAPLMDALQLAGKHLLPLVAFVRDEPGKALPDMSAIENVETIPVDADDAVAVCRVMQESTLRARNRWGAVVLRAISLPTRNDPVAAMAAHLERRGLRTAVTPKETR